jgi:uncharacterized membrane protein
MTKRFNSSNRFTPWGIERVLRYAFKQSDIAHSHTGIRETLKMSASYPNIDSVSNLFDIYRCPNMLVKVELKDLAQLEYSALLYMKTTGTERTEYYYGYLINITDDEAVYYIAGERINEPIEDFKSKWTSNLLIFRKTESSGEQNWVHKRVIEAIKTIAIIMAVFAFSIGLYQIAPHNYPMVILLLLMLGFSTAGLYLSIKLYKIENGLLFNTPEKNKCFIYKGFNCNKVFRSGWGKILNWVSLAELGAFYFFSLAAFVAFKMVTSNFQIGLIPYLTIPAVLFICYSLLTQWLLIKSWCSNCLWVQFILLCNSVIGFAFLKMQQAVSIKDLQNLLTIILLQIIVWNGGKRLLYVFSKHDLVRAELDAYKKDYNIFLNRVDTAAKLTRNPPVDFYIDVNNHEENELTIMISPFCDYCSLLVTELDKLATVGKLNARVYVVMNTTADVTSDSYNVWTIVCNALTVQPKNALEILLQWYALQNTDKFKRHFNYELPQSFPSRILNSHLQFCAAEEINQMPGIYYKNARIDHYYTLTEFSYFLN